VTLPLQTTVRRLGPGDEDVVRALAEREPQVGLLAERDNGPANALYESLGGERSEAVMWDYRYVE
jgi:FR47-like protein